MKFHPTSLALALAAVISGLSALPVQAALVTTASVAFNNSASVTDVSGNGATTVLGTSLGTTSIAQFDKNLGVLTGATLNLANSTHTQTTQVTSTDGANTGNNGQVTSNGTGSSSVGLSAAGVSNTFSPLSQADLCRDNRQGACTGTSQSSAASTDWVGNVSSGSLGSYVGSGAVLVTRTAPSLSASQTDDVFTGIESTTSTVTWLGDLSATYTYLLHAAPSFGNGSFTLDLDLGTVLQGAAAPSLAFGIFNAAGDRVGLDLDDVQGSGDLAQLYADLAGFSALGAGDSQGFFATLNTSTVGNFLTSYKLTLSDADVGVAASRSAYEMTLNLKGSVGARPQPAVNDVPEPGMLALVSAGLLGLGLMRRRHRRG
jgi:hypothetical protein